MSDSGTQFGAEVFTFMCKLFHIEKVESGPYHQQANGKLKSS